MKAISQEVVLALCVSFSSLPPKEAIVAFVWTDILGGGMGRWGAGWVGRRHRGIVVMGIGDGFGAVDAPRMTNGRLCGAGAWLAWVRRERQKSM